MRDDMQRRMRLALAGWVNAADGPSADAEHDAGTELADIVQELLHRGRNRSPGMVDDGEFSDLLNAGADMVIDGLSTFEIETSASIRWRSLIDLVVNAQGELSRTPDITLDEVIRAAYSEEPETVKGWIE